MVNPLKLAPFVVKSIRTRNAVNVRLFTIVGLSVRKLIGFNIKKFVKVLRRCL